MIESISFGTWLRQHRRALDLTQEAFADQVGCARITLSRIEAELFLRTGISVFAGIEHFKTAATI